MQKIIKALILCLLITNSIVQGYHWIWHKILSEHLDIN